MAPIFALGPSQGGPKEPKEPILSQLGRIPFWTLILDPRNHQKCSISKVPEPRKLSSRLDGSSIFTFSPVPYPNPKILDFGGFLGAFWEPFGSHLASLAPLGPPWGVPGAPRTALFGDCFSMDFFVYLFEAILVPKPLQNGRGAYL